MKQNIQKDIKNSINNIWLAGLGVASFAQKETIKAYDSLITEGKSLEKKSKSTYNKVSKQAEKRFNKVSKQAENRFNKVRTIAGKQFDKVEDLFENKIENVIKKLDIPTIKDIKGLSSKVDSLVKELKAKKVA